MRAYKKIRTGDYQLDQVQENISQFVAPFLSNPLLDGIIHKDKTINTTLALEHKLGRDPLGYLIVKKNINVRSTDLQAIIGMGQLQTLFLI